MAGEHSVTALPSRGVADHDLPWTAEPVPAGTVRLLVTVLVAMLAVAASVASVAGLLTGGGHGRQVTETSRGVLVTLYGEGLYAADTLLVGAGNRGQDVVMLAVEVGALVAALAWCRRGSLTGTVVLAGVLSFFTYYYVSMVFAAAQNRLFPVYVLAMGLALASLVRVLAYAVPRAAELQLPGRPGRRVLVTYLAAVALALTAAWLPGLLAVSLDGDNAAHVGPYTSAATEAVDLAVVVPLAVLAAVLMHRGAPLGGLLTLLVLVLNVCIGVLLMGQGVAQLLLDVPLTPAEIAGKMATFTVLTFMAGGLLVRMALQARRQPTRQPGPTGAIR